MRWSWRWFAVVALTLPVLAYAAGMLVSSADQPGDRAPIVVEQQIDDELPTPEQRQTEKPRPEQPKTKRPKKTERTGPVVVPPAPQRHLGDDDDDDDRDDDRDDDDDDGDDDGDDDD